MKETFFKGIAAFAAASIVSGCSMLGGAEPKITLSPKEVKSVKKVENVLLVPVIGLADDTLQKVILGAAVTSFGTKSRPQDALEAILSPVGAGSFAGLISAGFTSNFSDKIADYEKDKKQKPEKIKLPGKDAGKTDLKDPSSIIGKLKAETSAIAEITDALKSGDSTKLSESVNKAPNLMSLVNKFNSWLFDKMDTNYILLVHLRGTEADYNAKKKIALRAALVNTKTGVIRSFAEVEDSKGAVPMPFNAKVLLMANSVFSGITDKDEKGFASLGQQHISN